MILHAFDRLESGRGGCQDLVQITETGKEGISERFNVATGDAECQQQLQDGRVRARRSIPVDEPLAQPLTVTGFAIVAIVHNLDIGLQKTVSRWLEAILIACLKPSGKEMLIAA